MKPRPDLKIVVSNEPAPAAVPPLPPLPPLPSLPPSPPTPVTDPPQATAAPIMTSTIPCLYVPGM
jgi:hypothetical protein